jgi:hypothetical protein
MGSKMLSVIAFLNQKQRSGYHMSKGGGSAPQAPDPEKQIRLQTQANKYLMDQYLNSSRVNQVNPYGTSTWTKTPGASTSSSSQNPLVNSIKSSIPQPAPSGWAGFTVGPGIKGAENSIIGNNGSGAPIYGVGNNSSNNNASAGTYDAGDPFGFGGGAGDTWTQTQTLNPAEQAQLDQTRGITSNLLGQVSSAASTPLNFDSLTKLKDSLDTSSLYQGVGNVEADPIRMGLNDTDYANQRKSVEDALYNRNTSRLDPQWQQQENKLITTLANKGITEGSAAYNNALDNFSRQKNDSYTSARNESIIGGGAEQSRLAGLDLQSGNFANSAQSQKFGQGMSNAQLANSLRAQGVSEQQIDATLRSNSRNQGINEQVLAKTLPLQLLNSLKSGGSVNMPQFGQVPNAPQQSIDTMTPYNNQYSAQMNAYNQQQQNSQQTMGNLFGLGGTLGAALLSSKDFKENKTELEETLPKLGKLNIERWKYRDGIADSKNHIGAYAEDWKEIFGTGDGKSIPIGDMLGVCMKAIQELNQKVNELEAANVTSC